MKHLGDICKISGRDAPTVNVIIGGSPCQDLSIAGKRAGLEGKRSGLFMEQIRIIKEMREKDAESGRTGADIRPRFMVWENVPGAFSVNDGRDFAAVLEETIRVVEQEAPDILPPAKGWTNSGCYMGDGWSVAWRVLDAQFWGVPQRRRRIALVADFGGGCAPEILFERSCVSGHSESCGTEREGTAGDAADGFGVYCLQGNGIDRSDNAGCAGRGWTDGNCYTLNTVDRPAVVYPETSRALCARADSSPCVDRGQEFVCIENPISFLERAGCPGGGKGILVQQDKVGTLSTLQNQSVCYAKTTKPHSKDEAPTIKKTEISPTLSTFDVGESRTNTFVCYESHDQDSRYRPLGDISETVSAKYGTGGGNQPIVISAFDQLKQGQFGDGEKASTLTAHLEKEARDIVCAAVDIRNGTENPDINGTLQAKESGGTSLNLNNVVRQRYIVRRLTPLEAERLQGYPSGFEVDVSKMTKDEYIAFNLASGNIIADAEIGKVFATRGPGGKKLDEPIELKGTNVKGYRIVSIRNGQTKLQCRVHRIIWISQHGIIPDGYCIDHINNDKSDNRISNLQLLTPEQNSHKAHDDGLYKCGLDNKATKIDPTVKDEIAFIYAISDLTQRQLAEMYGISKSRIGQIIKEVGWTDIGEWTDTKGKKHKPADSPRYKALGNSIAIPPWLWVLSRLNAYCEEKTMASLFDGIGGFPLIWEFLNGKGSAVWCSEIEEFPIAVTKRRFPEDGT